MLSLNRIQQKKSPFDDQNSIVKNMNAALDV